MNSAQNAPHTEIQCARHIFDHLGKEKIERHCHSMYELIYILKGDGTYIVEGMEYPLHPNTLFLLRPYEYHYVCPKKPQPYERIVINFDSTLLPDVLQNHPMLSEQRGNYFSVSDSQSPLRSALNTLSGMIPFPEKSTKEDHDVGVVLLCATVTQILLLLTMQKPIENNFENSGTVLRVIEYLNQHLKEDISLDTLARDFFISKYHLCRIFRQQTGASIFTYFNTKRIALAQQMIAEGESATAVAKQLGFQDYSAFYRAYRRQTGAPPIRQRSTIK